MKAITTLLIICFVGCINACHGQATQQTTDIETPKKTVKQDSDKENNLLDEQVNMYGSIFELAGAGENNPLGGASNYMGLIEKMEISNEQKEILREQYKIYNLSLDPAKKDSMKIRIAKMLKNAIEKSQNDFNN